MKRQSFSGMWGWSGTSAMHAFSARLNFLNKFICQPQAFSPTFPHNEQRASQQSPGEDS
jgi:hypothetical protein